MRRVPRSESFGTVDAVEASVCPDGKSEVWNRLFRGSLQTQRARLRFHACNDPEEITIVALDLRADGWVVTGLRQGSTESIEHYLDHIRDVEILGDALAGHDLFDALPPLA